MDQTLSPWRLTGIAVRQLLMWPIILLVAILVLIGGGLAVITIGIPLLAVSIPLLHDVSDVHRGMASEILGVEVPADRRPVEGASMMQRLAIWATDPMTWRELVWALVIVPIGWALSLVTVLLMVLVVTGAFWWYGAPHIMRLQASLDRRFLTRGLTAGLEQRVATLTESRAETVDHAASELRRIERDLHDGAQARLVALGMTIGLAEDMMTRDPEAARLMLAEARDTTGAALGDIRSVVRGIHPPVLADRGLVGAVEALALDMAMPVHVNHDVPDRLPAPVESAAYFAIAECLANIGKHAGATYGLVEMRWSDGVLHASVADDGGGGADPETGTGMQGVMRRLAAFDGTMSVASPIGGPTLIDLEVPCALLSPRTTHS